MARREVDRGSKTESLRRQKGRVKTRITDNQAWGSCVQFTAAIWNPTGLDGEWDTTDSHMPEMVCLAGVSVVLLLSPLHSPPSSSSSSSLECFSILQGAQMKHLSHDGQHIGVTPGQPALKTQRCEGSFQQAKSELWNDPTDTEEWRFYWACLGLF